MLAHEIELAFEKEDVERNAKGHKFIHTPGPNRSERRAKNRSASFRITGPGWSLPFLLRSESRLKGAPAHVEDIEG